MTQEQRRQYLIRELLRERAQNRFIEMPPDVNGQKQLLRTLFNTRMPRPISSDFLKIQDAYLQEALREKGITDFSDLTPIQNDLYLWQGDITTLSCDAVVNAANSELLGCFYPCHACIDNAIHTYAGIQLRLECAEIMRNRGHYEKTGGAELTSAYNLPSRFVLHTVGPIIDSAVTKRDCALLADCYRSCLELAEQNGIGSLAFCCISTGEFRFPNKKAAQIAVRTVREYKERTNSRMKVIFNVFKNTDFAIYREMLG